MLERENIISIEYYFNDYPDETGFIEDEHEIDIDDLEKAGLFPTDHFKLRIWIINNLDKNIKWFKIIYFNNDKSRIRVDCMKTYVPTMVTSEFDTIEYKKLSDLHNDYV